MIVALDSGIASWRREMFPEYKAKRVTATNVWSNRLALHLNGAGLLCLRWPGDEADDIVATLALRASAKGSRPAVLSGDSDLLARLADLADVYQFGGKGEPRHVLRSSEWVCEKYHCRLAEGVWAYKALVGEPGDGVPGVPQIGPVKARRLLELAPAIEDIPKMLKESEAEAYALALELVTLRTDVPLAPIHPASCRLNAQRLVIA
jgi:DNA polymerase-1